MKFPSDLSFLTRDCVVSLPFVMLINLPSSVAFFANCSFVVEELCDLGVAMTSEEESFRRDSITIPLLSIVEKSGHSIVEAPSSGVTTMKPSNPTVFSEAEACYIMWHLFNTVRDRRNIEIR